MNPLITALALCALAPGLLAASAPAAAGKPAVAATAPAAMAKISTADLQQQLKAGTARLVDVRDHGKGLEVRRIAGPTTRLSAKARQATVEKKLPDKNALVVIYDTDNGSPKPSELARRLGEMGYADVRVYAEGFAGWLAAGLPVEDKTPPMKTSGAEADAP